MLKKFISNKYITSSIFFMLLIITTFFILFKNKDLFKIFTILNTANPIFILIGIICMFIFLICEGWNLKRILAITNNNITWYQTIKYAFVGFFFSSITPSSTGGQPMQIYYMKKDNINVSHSSIAILTEFASYQIVIVIYSIIALFIKFDYFMNKAGYVKYLILIGILANSIVFILIISMLFSKKASKLIISLYIKVINKISFIKENKKEKLFSKLDNFILEYNQSAELIKNNKSVIVKVLLTTAVQFFASFSIPYLVYRSLGFNTQSFSDIFLLQANLAVAVSIIPLPGAVGISENSFLTLYKAIYPAYSIHSAMLLSRGIRFYLFLIITGIISGITYNKKNLCKSPKTNVIHKKSAVTMHNSNT